MSNIKSFSDKNKEKDSKNRQVYIGGEKSGLLVEDDNDLSAQLIKRA